MARFALAVAVVALLAVAPLPASADVSFIFGGATSFNDMASGSLVPNFKAFAAGPYQSVGSALGIDRFKSGVYGVGVSDEPMNVGDDGAVSKYTIPLVISTYSFFVGSSLKRGSIKLDALQTFNIYKNGGSWQSYTTALKGPITRVARSDGSGTSLVFKKFWLDGSSNARVSAAASFPGNPDESPFPFAGMVLKSGGSAVCSAAAAVAGSIVYSQTGTCNKYNTAVRTRLSEVAVKNAANVFVAATGTSTNVIQVLPRPPKAPAASWSDFNLMFSRGAATPPIASCIFAFIRRQQKSLGPKATQALAFLKWVNNNAVTYAGSYGFVPMPADYKAQSTNALNIVM